MYEYISPYLVLLNILIFLPDKPCYPMGLIRYYQITCQPVNQAICIFIIVQLYFVILFQ